MLTAVFFHAIICLSKGKFVVVQGVLLWSLWCLLLRGDNAPGNSLKKPSDIGCFVFNNPRSQNGKTYLPCHPSLLPSIICSFYLPVIWNKTFSCLCFYRTWSAARTDQTCCEIKFRVILRISCHLFLTLHVVNKCLLAEDHKQSYNLCASIFHMSRQERYLSMTSFHLIHFPVSLSLYKAFILHFYFFHIHFPCILLNHFCVPLWLLKPSNESWKLLKTSLFLFILPAISCYLSASELFL